MVGVGDLAPDFDLKDQNGNSVKLSSFKGKKVLLAFFPFAFSPVCTDEMGCFQADLTQFKNKGAEVLAISVDSTWSNKAFADKLGLAFPILSDFSKEVCKKYGTLRAEGFSNRAYFVVGKEGKVTYKHVMPTPGEKLDNAALLKALA